MLAIYCFGSDLVGLKLCSINSQSNLSVAILCVMWEASQSNEEIILINLVVKAKVVKQNEIIAIDISIM